MTGITNLGAMLSVLFLLYCSSLPDQVFTLEVPAATLLYDGVRVHPGGAVGAYQLHLLLAGGHLLTAGAFVHQAVYLC